MFKIKTKVVGNPDYGQDPRKPPFGVKNEVIAAETLDDLKSKVRDWCTENSIGGGNWVEPKVTVDGECIGYMSYNCRVWDAADDGDSWRTRREVA